MIDERFSSAEFMERGLGTSAARELADLLQDELEMEMYGVILARWLEIVAKLNAMGHSLQEEYPPRPIDISYRDDWRDEQGYHCKLRIGWGATGSAGYGDVIDSSDKLAFQQSVQKLLDS